MPTELTQMAFSARDEKSYGFLSRPSRLLNEHLEHDCGLTVFSTPAGSGARASRPMEIADVVEHIIHIANTTEH